MDLTRIIVCIESRGMNDMRIPHGLKLEDGTLEVILPVASAVKRVVIKENPSDAGVLLMSPNTYCIGCQWYKQERKELRRKRDGEKQRRYGQDGIE